MLRTTLLFITCFCCWISAAIGADLPQQVTLLQNGTVVKAASNGDYLLAQGPFTIRAEFAGRPASIIATTDARALTQLKTLKRPLISFPGFGAASSPGVLLVADPSQNDPLELYSGWSTAFDSEFGESQGPEIKARYLALRKGLKEEPTIIVSGRQYINFEPVAGGAEEMQVQELTGVVPVGVPLYFLVFADNQLTATPPEIYSLDWTALTVRFQQRP